MVAPASGKEVLTHWMYWDSPSGLDIHPWDKGRSLVEVTCDVLDPDTV